MKTLQITYTDNNTSGIQPKPLQKRHIEKFCDILVEVLKEQQKQKGKNHQSIHNEGTEP